MSEVTPATNNYQITDVALKSLANSRNTRRGIPARNYSGNSNKSGGSNKNNDTTINNNNNGGATTIAASNNNTNTAIGRASGRSSNGSMWSSLLGRGRRIYGSAVSVASSITLTEFAGDFSEEFEISERSLDVKQIAAMEEHDANDKEPTKPQRQVSIAAGLSWFSDHTRTTNPLTPPSSVAVGADATNKRSSDLSPRQPGRKTSIRTLNSDLSMGSPEQAHKQLTAPYLRKDSKDSVPTHPTRKTSSKLLMEESILEEMQSDEFLDQETNFVQAVKDILMQQQHIEGTTYDNVFVGQLAIDRMIEMGMVDSRQEALEVGRSLQETQKLFQHIHDKDKPLEDSSQALYVLAPPPPPDMPAPHVMSVRRKTDTSISIEEEAPLEEDNAKPIMVPPVKQTVATQH